MIHNKDNLVLNNQIQSEIKAVKRSNSHVLDYSSNSNTPLKKK